MKGNRDVVSLCSVSICGFMVGGGGEVGEGKKREPR